MKAFINLVLINFNILVYVCFLFLTFILTFVYSPELKFELAGGEANIIFMALFRSFGLDIFFVLFIVLLLVVLVIWRFLNEKGRCILLVINSMVGIFCNYMVLGLLAIRWMLKTRWKDNLSEEDPGNFWLDYFKEVSVRYSSQEYKKALKDIIEEEFGFEYGKLTVEVKEQLLKNVHSMAELRKRIAEYVNSERNPGFWWHFWDFLTSTQMIGIYKNVAALMVTCFVGYVAVGFAYKFMNKIMPGVFNNGELKITKGINELQGSNHNLNNQLNGLTEHVMVEFPARLTRVEQSVDSIVNTLDAFTSQQLTPAMTTIANTAANRAADNLLTNFVDITNYTRDIQGIHTELLRQQGVISNLQTAYTKLNSAVNNCVEYINNLFLPCLKQIIEQYKKGVNIDGLEAVDLLKMVQEILSYLGT